VPQADLCKPTTDAREITYVLPMIVAMSTADFPRKENG
jgi:hypothetical protein